MRYGGTNSPVLRRIQFCNLFNASEINEETRKITWSWEKARWGVDYRIVNSVMRSEGWLQFMSKVC